MPKYAPCPKCGSEEADSVTFTWWGGIVGPRVLNHVKCRECGCGYNGKTGNLNTRGITVWVIVGVVVSIAFIACFVLFEDVRNFFR